MEPKKLITIQELDEYWRLYQAAVEIEKEKNKAQALIDGFVTMRYSCGPNLGMLAIQMHVFHLSPLDAEKDFTQFKDFMKTLDDTERKEIEGLVGSVGSIYNKYVDGTTLANAFIEMWNKKCAESA